MNTRVHHQEEAESCYQCQYSKKLPEEAAEHAVKKVFAILGVDVDRPESVEEFREDLRFGKKMRKAAGHGTFAFIAVASAAFAFSTNACRNICRLLAD